MGVGVWGGVLCKEGGPHICAKEVCAKKVGPIYVYVYKTDLIGHCWLPIED